MKVYFLKTFCTFLHLQITLVTIIFVLSILSAQTRLTGICNVMKQSNVLLLRCSILFNFLSYFFKLAR